MTSSKILALVAISSILCLMVCGNAKTTQTEQRLNHQNPSSSSKVKNTELKGVRFEPKSAVDGLTKEHYRFSSETWEANDGVPIFLRREYCGSPKKAERALREAVKTALAILETRRLRNRNRETGRRIVATFDKERPHQRVIYWTNGEMLYSLESSSFGHALLFEKMFPSL
jgi:hypothetical protein